MSNPKGKDAKGPVFIVSIIHLGQCRKMVTFHWSMNNQSGLIELELPGREGGLNRDFCGCCSFLISSDSCHPEEKPTLHEYNFPSRSTVSTERSGTQGSQENSTLTTGLVLLIQDPTVKLPSCLPPFLKTPNKLS